jgi:hypothetical protein
MTFYFFGMEYIFHTPSKFIGLLYKNRDGIYGLLETSLYIFLSLHKYTMASLELTKLLILEMLKISKIYFFSWEKRILIENR